MSKKTDRFSKATMLTLPKMEDAEPHLSQLKSMLLQSTKFKQDLLNNFSLPLLKDQPSSLLRLTDPSSRDTPAVSSTPLNVEPNLITPSLLSDTEPQEANNTTLSETHGDQDGETMVTSTSPPNPEAQLVSAVSNKSPSGQPCNETIQNPITLTNIKMNLY